MKKLFHHYTEWEDFKAGLFELPSKQDDSMNVTLARMLLANQFHFLRVGLRMVQEWRISSEVNLSNRSRNRQAWIGQASCCFAFGSREHQTKEAWHMLTIDQQRRANLTADEIIEEWESVYA